MKPLNKNQAIALSGYTGILLCEFGLLHKDVEKRLDRKVYFHEFGNTEFKAIIKDLYRPDILAIAYQ
jgi:hypothetical protein